MINVGFNTKTNTFVLFLGIFSGSTFNKMVTMATAKGLSIICKFRNLAYTYL